MHPPPARRPTRAGAGARAPAKSRAHAVKKVLLQLDTDQHPSPFDAIVAEDAGVEVLLSHGGVTPEAVQDLVQGAFFTRAPDDLSSMAVWVGGSDVSAGERILDEVQAAYFGPFRISAMHDS